jgi:hypothetical protein
VIRNSLSHLAVPSIQLIVTGQYSLHNVFK